MSSPLSRSPPRQRIRIRSKSLYWPPSNSAGEINSEGSHPENLLFLFFLLFSHLRGTKCRILLFLLVSNFRFNSRWLTFVYTKSILIRDTLPQDLLSIHSNALVPHDRPEKCESPNHVRHLREGNGKPRSAKPRG